VCSYGKALGNLMKSAGGKVKGRGVTSRTLRARYVVGGVGLQIVGVGETDRAQQNGVDSRTVMIHLKRSGEEVKEKKRRG